MGASLLPDDLCPSPGNVRPKHSCQRSHFLVKEPTEFISFVCLFPLKAMEWRTEREGGVVETAQHLELHRSGSAGD